MAVMVGNEVLENALPGHGARSTLGAALLSSTQDASETITFASTEGGRFPALSTGQCHRVRVEDEIITLTAHTADADTATGLRGQEGTDAAAHTLGTKVTAVVSADALAAIGTRWGVTHFRAGRYYSPSIGGGPDAGGGYGANRLVFSPFFCPETRTFDRIGCGITVLFSPSTVALGIWKNDRAGIPGPGTLVLDAGTVDSSTTGYKEITISEELSPGLYWLGARSNHSNVSIRRTSSGHVILGTSTLGGSTGAAYLDGAAAFASDPAWAESGQLAMPFLFLRTV